MVKGGRTKCMHMCACVRMCAHGDVAVSVGTHSQDSSIKIHSSCPHGVLWGHSTLNCVQGEIKFLIHTFMLFRFALFYCGGTERTYTQTTIGLKEDRLVQVRENTWIPSFPRTQALWEASGVPVFSFTSLSGSRNSSTHASSFVEVFYSLFLGEAMEWSGCSLRSQRNFCDVRFHVTVSSEVIATRQTTKEVV